MEQIRSFQASDSSDSDSDHEANWKKKSTRTKVTLPEESCAPLPNRKKKAHEMWTDNLTEQTLTEGLGQCQLKKPKGQIFSRGSESYDFTIKSSDPRIDETQDAELFDDDAAFGYDYDQKIDDDLDEFGVCKENRKVKIPKVKERLGNKQHEGKYNLQKVAEKIINTLKEQKPELVQRCVQFLGPRKALDLLSMTLTVEEAGGMTIKDGSRRRTPGGVYFQLLRNDPNIRKDVMNQIFQDEKAAHNEMKKAFRKMKRKQERKKRNNEKNTEQTIEDLLPNSSLTAATLASEPNVSNTSDIEEGEIMDD